MASVTSSQTLEPADLLDLKPPRFCEECGARLPVAQSATKFDQATGQLQTYYMNCPTGKCMHLGIGHEAEPARGIIERIRRAFSDKLKCRKCGQDFYDHWYD